LATTRKSGKIKDSILIAQLKKWERFPADHVVRGIETYLSKDYAAQGKREDYLLGIIRNTQPGKIESKSEASTGSALLDAYYEREAQGAVT